MASSLEPPIGRGVLLPPSGKNPFTFIRPFDGSSHVYCLLANCHGTAFNQSVQYELRLRTNGKHFSRKVVPMNSNCVVPPLLTPEANVMGPRNASTGPRGRSGGRSNGGGGSRSRSRGRPRGGRNGPGIQLNPAGKQNFKKIEDVWVEVIVKKVLPEIILASAKESLPADYNADALIAVRKAPFGKIGSLLDYRDTLKVVLGTKDKTKPFAIKANVVKCQPFNDERLRNFLILCKTIVNVDQEQNFESTEAILALIRPVPIWEGALSSKAIDSSIFRLLIKILAQLAKKVQGKEAKKFFEKITLTSMFHPIKGRCLEFADDMKRSYPHAIQNLKDFFHNAIIRHCPKNCGRVLSLLEVVSDSEDNFWMKTLKTCLRHISQDNDVAMLEWNELPKTPTTAELSACSSELDWSLSPVPLNVGFESNDQYFDTFVRLLREDCFYELKQGIQKLMSQKKLDPRDMKIHKGVQIKGYFFSDSGLNILLSVKREKSSPKIPKRGELQSGNLLCISPLGTFKDPIWATCVLRDKQYSNNDELRFMIEPCAFDNMLNLQEILQGLFLRSGKLIVAESPTYYRAHEPVLTALQNRNCEDFPFTQEVVNLNKEYDTTPEYLIDFDISELPQTDIIYDESQQEAVKHVFANRVSMIQGPPGCGKTFIGVQIVKTLVENIPIPDSPILVLTYKNHALDEFLLRIGNLIGMHNICRVGGRCTEPRLEAVKISSIKSEKRSSKCVDLQQTWRAISELKDEIEVAASEFDKSLKELQKLSYFEPLDFVLDYFTEEQIQNLLLNANDITLTGKPNFKTITAKKKLVKGAIEAVVKDGKQTMDNLGMLGLKDVLSSEMHDERLSDLRTVVAVVLNAWTPDQEVVSEVETEFCVSQSTLGAELADKNGSDDVVDDDNDDDEFEERLNYISSFRDIDETLGRLSSFGTNKMKNHPSMSLLPFAEKLCENSPDTILESTDNLWTLSSRCRLIVIQKKLMERFSGCKRVCEELQEDYSSLCQQKFELEERYSAAAVFDRKVIAMTITGASIHSHMLASLTPKIVIVEEAAEVLEPQLMAVLGPQVQHLIMIGDHKQLPPSVQCHKLAVDYNFNTSMMQRLIQGNMPFVTLRYQNRMRPSISKYLKDIYPNLKDGPRVHSIKRVDLFKSDVFFWDHESPEVKERSVSNKEEAERAVRLAMFLISQKIEPTNITIISAYSGQNSLVRKRLEEIQKSDAFKNIMPPNLAREDNVKTHTIDMYQGDENDIVIVSLVRSNDESQTGFVKLLNRRCVAQSRAKRAIIFIGNFQTLNDARHWKPFLKSLSDEGFMGKELPLVCPKHSTKKISIRDSSSFPNENYCTSTCGSLMSCKAHLCQKPCMPSHDHVKCTAKVKYRISSKCEHIRARKCFENPQEVLCSEPCPNFLPCKHKCPKACEPKHDHPAPLDSDVSNLLKRFVGTSKTTKPENSIFCSVRVKHICKACKLEGDKACSESESYFKCLGNCKRILECKHPCTKKCHEVCPSRKECEFCIKLEKKKADEMRKFKEEQIKKSIEMYEKQFQKAKSDSTVKVVKRIVLTPNDAQFFHVKDLVLKFIQPMHNWNPRIVQIEEVVNLELTVRYQKSLLKMFDPSHESEKFHGSSKEGVDLITKDGFKIFPSNGGNMFGDGVYLASDSSKSAREIYTKNSNMLLLCKVALGKCLTVTTAQKEMTGEILRKKGYDSLFAKRDSSSSGGVHNDEFVVFDTDRVLPKYVIHYEKDGFIPNAAPSAIKGSVYQKIQLENKREGSDKFGNHYKLVLGHIHALMARPLYNGPKNIEKIYYHLNPILEDKFKIQEHNMKFKYKGKNEADFILAFHGTPNPENIDKIVRENFRMDKIRRTAHGHGIYFSEFPEISLQYAGSNWKLLLCKILPGKSHEGDCRMPNCSCDSHRVGAEADGRGQMIVMFEPDRILPCYEIHLRN